MGLHDGTDHFDTGLEKGTVIICPSTAGSGWPAPSVKPIARLLPPQFLSDTDTPIFRDTDHQGKGLTTSSRATLFTNYRLWASLSTPWTNHGESRQQVIWGVSLSSLHPTYHHPGQAHSSVLLTLSWRASRGKKLELSWLQSNLFKPYANEWRSEKINGWREERKEQRRRKIGKQLKENLAFLYLGGGNDMTLFL